MVLRTAVSNSLCVEEDKIELDLERTPPALLLGRNLGFHCSNVCSHASKSGV